MQQYTISKQFDFCYGHRVSTQVLNGEYSDNLKCACRHFHGHQGTVVLHLRTDAITNGMVTDLRHTEWLKRFIDTYIDHQFIFYKDDPLYNQFVGADTPLSPITVPGHDYTVGYSVDLAKTTANGAEYEFLEGLLVVDFVPTSENLSKWLADFVDVKMSPLGVQVSHVEWHETPKSCATYYKV